MKRLNYIGTPPMNILGLVSGKTTKARVKEVISSGKVESVEFENLADENHLKIQNVRRILNK